MKLETKEKLLKIIDKTAFFFFGVLVFFLPISNAAIESCFAFILLCFLLRNILKRPTLEETKKFFKNKINLAVLIFYICIGFSLFMSGPLLAMGARAWISKWGEGVALFYFAQVFLKKKDVRILLYVFLASALLVCIDGFYQRITGLGFVRGFELSKVGASLASTATFHYHNNFASYLVVLFFINLGAIKKYNGNKILEIVFPLLLLSIVVSLFFTYSRGAWVAFLITTLFLAIFFSNNKIRAMSFFSLLVFIAGVIFLPSIRERFFFMFQPGGDSDRLRIWAIAISMFKDSPFLGRGLGSFMSNFRQYSSMHVQYAHNCYLQILAETGLLGLLSFLWFLKELIFRAYKKLKENFDGLFLGVFGGFLALSIHSFFDTQFYDLQLSALFWLLASFLAIYANQKTVSSD